MRPIIFLLLATVSLSQIAPAEDRKRTDLEVPGLEVHYDVPYLPAERYTGAAGPRGDVEMTMDLFVPRGGGPYPLVFYVHGGSYTGGSKYLSGTNKQLAQALVRAGFAVGSLNYILKPKGIMPQVWWDFHDAIRFVRRRAEDFRIDPLRIGAFGISAGGWLLGSACSGNGDLLMRSKYGIWTHELRDQGWKHARQRDPHGPDSWLRPIRDPSPAWPGVHGGVSAIAMDFDHHTQYYQPWNPYFLKWAGHGYRPKSWKQIQANGAEGVYEVCGLLDTKSRGKKVHCPKFFKTGSSEARNAAGDEGMLGDLTVDFFRRRLVTDYRLPAPEIFPVPRLIQGRTDVTLVPPPGAVVHYSVDGSEPSAASRRFEQPFTISGDTVVKAIAVADGLADSGVNVARFVEGPAPARITGPAELPSATTGEPYEVRFTSDAGDQARWMLQGELVPYQPRKKHTMRYPNNMALDRDTGVWSGTPFKPGVYWIQVWVNDGSGRVATHRNYRWEVRGEARPGLAWERQATATDTNVSVARLGFEAWKSHFDELGEKLASRGIPYVLAGDEDEERLFIVESRHLAEASNVLKQLIGDDLERQRATTWLAQH